MAWIGWFSFDGTEIVNVQRTETYMANVGWFRPAYRNEYIAPLLGERYRTPSIDDAPWTDPDVPESYDFWGAYPLDVTGLEDDTATATVTESTLDGGTASRRRHATRSIVFSLVLQGGSDAACEYGLNWLKEALAGSACSSSPWECSGGALCYLSSEPVLDLSSSAEVTSFYSDVISGGGVTPPVGDVISGGDTTPAEDIISSGDVVGVSSGAAEQQAEAMECLPPILRSLQRVTVTVSPVITAKHDLTDGSAVWVITFTANAGIPFTFGSEIPAITGFGDPAITDPWAGDVPDGLIFDPDGYIHTDIECVQPITTPFYDPLCPAVVPPPGPPTVPLGCFTPPVNWLRRSVSIPKEVVPLWGAVVPQIKLHARAGDVRNVRIRLYPDPLNLGDVDSAPCDYCGDIVFSYIPDKHTLIFDGVLKAVWIEAPGGARRRADSLVFATDGTPFEWPELTCGAAYTVAIDTPQTSLVPVVDISLFSKAS